MIGYWGGTDGSVERILCVPYIVGDGRRYCDLIWVVHQERIQCVPYITSWVADGVVM